MIRTLWQLYRNNQLNRLLDYHQLSYPILDTFNQAESLVAIDVLDNVHKQNLINYIELIKQDMLKLIIKQVDSPNGVIFMNGCLSSLGRLQTEIKAHIKVKTIKPNNGLSKQA